MKIYFDTVKSWYGNCIKGSSRGYQYRVYVKENKETKTIEHKLYYIMKDNKWVRSILKYFSGNKVAKVIRSENKDVI